VEASDLAARAKELECSLEDTRRRLAEERQLKDNFEDLLTAMRVELEQHKNERDNLRDQVVPQVQAQVQQELEALRAENAALIQATRMQLDIQQQVRIDSIAEEGGEPPRRNSFGLSRSNSVARISPRSGGLARSGSLSRPSSVIGKDREFRESLVDRLKDVETQRDALHQTVKNLLGRQIYQARENAKRIRVLELELDRARQSGSPRRLGYEREVKNLREEINLLRRRADDALEQKWQCEKGLGSVKMDLDRAEQETGSLRALLEEHDITVPGHWTTSHDGPANFHATASSLEEAYKQLQADREYVENNRLHRLASPIKRNETLATQVCHQVATNNSLRTRLSQAIGKGEREQKLSASKITEMQDRLKSLEDALLLAQQRSEEEVANHEEEIRTLKESHNAQLLRAGTFSPIQSSSSFAALRSPRLSKTSCREGMPLNQAIQAETLEAQVKELEKALRDADMEMEKVVGRMNMAQIEAAELQSDRYASHTISFAPAGASHYTEKECELTRTGISNRDEALRKTRRLQNEILAERQKYQTLATRLSD
jgi:hypothetical protein